jgi:hypothetical protein
VEAGKEETKRGSGSGSGSGIVGRGKGGKAVEHVVPTASASSRLLPRAHHRRLNVRQSTSQRFCDEQESGAISDCSVFFAASSFTIIKIEKARNGISSGISFERLLMFTSPTAFFFTWAARDFLSVVNVLLLAYYYWHSCKHGSDGGQGFCSSFRAFIDCAQVDTSFIFAFSCSSVKGNSSRLCCPLLEVLLQLPV